MRKEKKVDELRVVGWTTANDHKYPTRMCDTAEIYNTIVNEIREKGYCFGGAEHLSPNLPCTPVLSDGCKICCSDRIWGAIMADAKGLDNTDGMAYVAYMFMDLSEEAVYPRKSVNYYLINKKKNEWEE